jgi:thiol-disulfide isomerase/thioredoxin
MISRRRHLATFGAALLTPASAIAQAAPPPPALDALENIALTQADGAATTLGAHLTPGPAVVQFWATWCGPCIAETRHLSRTRRTLGADRLAIVGVNVQRRDQHAEAEIARFLERTRPNYPQVRGDMAAYRAFSNGETLLLPRLYVFAADGRPVAAFGRYNGAATFRAIDRAIESVVAN